MTKNFQITHTHVLSLIAALAVFVTATQGYQMTLLLNDTSLLRQTIAQQNEPFAQAQRLQQQLSGLVNGTLQLADRGNKNVVPVVNRLRELNIIPAPQQQSANPQANNSTSGAFPAPVPAAQEAPQPRGPVKP